MGRDISSLYGKIMNGDRVALGQAMTLVESEIPDDRIEAVQLLELCQLQTASKNKSIRFAISGAPGVGKSTLINSIGLKAISQGYKVGVITIDPSSIISRGSILGDKSRMSSLSLSPSAFIRSSPAGTVLGGIGRRSFELMALLEATGYNLIFVETVGVGQSEHVAWQLTDGFILVVQPGGGDELQGIKRGITELADIIIVNKADAELKQIAATTGSQYKNAIHYLSPLRSDWNRQVLTCSATEGNGIHEFWGILRLYIESQKKNDQTETSRKRQNEYWLSWSLGITAHDLLMNHEDVKQKLAESQSQIKNQDVFIFKTEFEIEEIMKSLIRPYGKENLLLNQE